MPGTRGNDRDNESDPARENARCEHEHPHP